MIIWENPHGQRCRRRATRSTDRPTPPPPADATRSWSRARAHKDFAAFEELLDRYEDKVFRLAFRFVRNETDAKEILQETFLSIWRKLDTFKGDAQFGSWLYRVATNAALMRLRAQRRHPRCRPRSCRSATSTTTASAAGGGELVEAPRRPAAVGRAAPPHPGGRRRAARIYRTVFLIRDVEGLSTEETAEVLGISVPTVKTRLHRARIALRDAIGGYFDQKLTAAALVAIPV